MKPDALKIRELFVAAVGKVPPLGWDAFLDDACGDNARLRREVSELLQAHQDAASFLDQPVAQLCAPEAIEVSPDLLESPWARATIEGAGTVIGSYKLLEQIGEGGMGLVFMAEQTRPVRRKVALKILKPGMDTRQVVARFEAERQALAMMDHANIAKVFDAGATETGRPYFVMELVHGVPITTYCDQHRLTPRQRLELFITVCQAVQHAHQKGIIHRDLKPSNVLVTLHDTFPVPKVIDFGIAKATGQQLTDKTLFTHFAQMIGTPMYMSPEQAEMNELGVDTRSDVYALGVMLYELLTGATPFDGETLKKAGYDEMRRIIREVEPARPSDRVSTLEAAACTTVSARRGMDERRLAPLLRGELDWIVMKALDKDRNRRYESASALAADLQRYLNDEPVEACPPSRWYRLRKVAKRQRRSLAMVFVIAIALVTATVVSAWQAVIARDAQHQAEADRERAKAAEKQAEAAERRAASEAAIAKAVNDFLQADLLKQANPLQQFERGFATDPDLTVKEALHRAAAGIGEQFQDQPLVQAAIRRTIGDAYYAMGEYKLAIGQLEKALALRNEYLGPDHPDTLNCVQILGSAYIDAGHPDAIAFHEEALPLFKATFGPDHPLTTNFVWGYARAYHMSGNFEKAERLFRTALAISRQNDGPKPRVATTFALVWLSRSLLLQKKYAEAEPLAREALEISVRDAPDRFFRFVYMSVLGGALLGQKRYEEAEPLLLEGYEGLKTFGAAFGSPWDWRVAEAVQRIVDFYDATNQPEKARQWREKLTTDNVPR